MNAKGTLSTTSAAGLPSTALRNKVAMPAAATDQGNPGDYAVDTNKLAVYVASVGWEFYPGLLIGPSGTIPPEYIGTGTRTGLKFLRDDGAFVTLSGGGDMLAANNLGDVGSFASARANLGVYSQAEVDAQRNALAPRGGLAFDGTSGTKALATLTGQAFTTAPLAVEMILEVPASNPAGLRGIFFLSPSASDAFNASTLTAWIDTTNTLNVRISGAASTDYNNAACSLSSYAGKRIHLFVTRTGSTVAVYINGVAQTLTATTGGTPPTWAGSITSTYFVVGTVQVGSEFNGSIYIASLYNLAPAASDVLEVYEIGGVVPERFKFGSQASITSGTLTIGKAYRITSAGGTFTGVGAANNSVGTTFIATATTPTWSTGAVVRAGAVVRYDADLDGIGYQLHDQSSNKLDATITTTGASWTKQARRGYVRGTLTWAGTHELKSLLGQRCIPNDARWDAISVKATTGSSGSGIRFSDASDTYTIATVSAFTTAKKAISIIATNVFPGGTSDNNCNLSVDPDTANFTGSIAIEAQYSLTEGNP